MVECLKDGMGVREKRKERAERGGEGGKWSV